MELQYTLSRSEFLRRGYRQAGSMVFAWICATCISALSISSPENAGESLTILEFGAADVVLLLILTGFFIIRRYRLHGQSVELVIDDTGVRWVTDEADVRLPWNGIAVLRREGASWKLHTKRRTAAVVIPDRVFADDSQRHEFLDLFLAHGVKPKWRRHEWVGVSATS